MGTIRWRHLGKPIWRLVVSSAAVFAVTAALYAVPLSRRPLTAALAFLFVVLVVSATWGFRYSLFVSLLAALGFSWLLASVGRFWLSEPRGVLVLAALLVVGITTSRLSDRVRREALNARRSASELRDLIENVPAMVFMALPGPSNVFASRGWHEYTGLPTEETAGAGWQTVIHPEDLGRHIEKWRVCSATGEPFEDEARFRCAADGEYRWFLVRAVPLRDVHGNILKWYGILTDIEDRKRTEQALRRSEAYLAQAETLSRTGSWVWHPMTDKVLYWSEELLRIFDVDPGELTSLEAERFIEHIHPEDRAKVRASLDKIEHTCEYRLLLPSGTIKHVLSRQHKVFDQSGELVEVVGTIADVTERKRSEEALRRSEAYLAEAQRLTRTGSWAYNLPTEKAIYWSEEMFRIFGLNPQRSSPPDRQEFLRLMHPADRDRFNERVEKAFREKTDFAQDYRIVLPDGTVKHLHEIGHPVLDETGNIVEYVGTEVDVTERKRAEEERERLRQVETDLAHIGRVTTLGELAASLAHELNQPITAAITNANTSLRWLARIPPNLDEAREAITRIVKDGTRAAEIINRLRSFYKKGTPPQPELVDVNEVAHEMMMLLRNETNRYSIAMRTELAPELPKVMADRVQLQQVFMNLMLNGIEAMMDDGGELTITSERTEDRQLRISISDTGVGLPSEKVDHVFDAFFTTKPQGTGMGLAITRSIVEAHGGRLWASANTGSGATFHFTLPNEAAASLTSAG
ncbi:MAG TPA: PAS domain-containing protein [Candidatus Acidoferrum sp.]|jgi:PAS domain S-box-containing protein